jgi:alkanesulfonate monooxygenase SsuD/methylene tetrahydromethanopterin reductase-like flavin-dependent oxidoreductase (luciferase family)
VDALEEAIHVIRELWKAEPGGVRFEGEHYQLAGAHRGPAPVRDINLRGCAPRARNNNWWSRWHASGSTPTKSAKKPEARQQAISPN